MPASVIILLGCSAVGLMITIPAMILLTAFRSRTSSKLPTVLALLLWGVASVALLGVWFLVTIAAHKVDDSLTNSWLLANAAYPIIGIGIARIHRRVLRRRATGNETGDS